MFVSSVVMMAEDGQGQIIIFILLYTQIQNIPQDTYPTHLTWGTKLPTYTFLITPLSLVGWGLCHLNCSILNHNYTLPISRSSAVLSHSQLFTPALWRSLCTPSLHLNFSLPFLLLSTSPLFHDFFVKLSSIIVCVRACMRAHVLPFSVFYQLPSFSDISLFQSLLLIPHLPSILLCLQTVVLCYLADLHTVILCPMSKYLGTAR